MFQWMKNISDKTGQPPPSMLFRPPPGHPTSSEKYFCKYANNLLYLKAYMIVEDKLSSNNRIVQYNLESYL